MYNPHCFADEEHRAFYYRMCSQYGHDRFRASLFYCIGSTDVTRRHYRRIYDTEEQMVIPECIYESWQTSGTLRMILLGFELYHGGPVIQDDTEDSDRLKKLYSISSVFSSEMLEVKLEAVRIRFGFEVSI